MKKTVLAISVAICTITATATSNPISSQSYGTTSTVQNNSTVTTTTSPSTTKVITTTPVSPKNEKMEHDGETCPMEKASSDVASLKIESIINQPTVTEIEEAMKKETGTQACLSGFANVLDLSVLIPKNYGSVSQAAIANAIQQGVKQMVETQKQKVRQKVCETASFAIKKNLEHIQGEIVKLSSLSNGLKNPDALNGLIKNKMDGGFAVINDKISGKIDALTDKISKAGNISERWNLEESNSNKIIQDINRYAQNAQESQNKDPMQSLQPSLGRTPSTNTNIGNMVDFLGTNQNSNLGGTNNPNIKPINPPTNTGNLNPATGGTSTTQAPLPQASASSLNPAVPSGGAKIDTSTVKSKGF